MPLFIRICCALLLGTFARLPAVEGADVRATAGGAVIACPQQALEGRLSATGLDLRSVGEAGSGGMRVRALRLARADWSYDLSPGVVEVAGGTAHLVRPGMREEITTSGSGIRQDWIVLERPPGTGALALKLALDEAAVSAVADEHIDLAFAGGR